MFPCRTWWYFSFGRLFGQTHQKPGYSKSCPLRELGSLRIGKTPRKIIQPIWQSFIKGIPKRNSFQLIPTHSLSTSKFWNGYHVHVSPYAPPCGAPETCRRWVKPQRAGLPLPVNSSSSIWRNIPRSRGFNDNG